MITLQITRKSFSGLFIAALLSTNLLANEIAKPRKTMEISLNPIKLVFGELPFNFRAALTEKMALGFNAYGRFFGLGSHKIYGAGGGINAKFFLNGTAISDSWYVQPGIDAGFSNYDAKGYWNLAPSVIGGYTWVWDSGFLINLGLGVQYIHVFVDKNIFGRHSYSLTGILPTGEFSLGYAW